MKIKSLASTPGEEVITCFLAAFENYFVKLPNDVEYWKSRFVTARVDWELSFGMFDEEKLVGFIINGIDKHNGKLTAYNTGTGILPEYRGSAIVDKIYAHAIPRLKEKGIEKCLLEVICENEKAINVYERIGFRITRTLKTFSGNLPKNNSGKTLQEWHFSEVLKSELYRPQHYSWDNSAGAIKISEEKVKTYALGEAAEPEAYISIDDAGNIIQLESRTGNYEALLSAAGELFQEVKLKNVDAEREALIHTLKKWHFSNPVNQFEMEMFL